MKEQKIDGIVLSEEYIWSPVTYIHPDGTQEPGILKSWNDSFIFVVFCRSRQAAACDPEHIVWG